MNHGSLFSGIGGFDLAAEWMGWNNVFHCEWNPFGQKVLKHYWPNAISYENICTTDFTVHRGKVDLITGGFPCQPYSLAGKRLGKADERHLFPEMLRCIKEIKPRWIIGENVRGLVSWNGGLVFQEVYDDLEREGYEVLSFLIPAASVGAPHQRYRIWFVAYSNSRRLEGTNEIGRNGVNAEWKSELGDVAYSNSHRHTSCRKGTEAEGIRGEDNGIQKQWSESSEWSNGLAGFQRDVANSVFKGLQRGQEIDRWKEYNKKGGGNEFDTRTNSKNFNKKTRRNFEEFPTVSPICNGDDGLSNRLDNITFPKWRNESIKAGGNAIVPQVALQIFKTIEKYETTQQRNHH